MQARRVEFLRRRKFGDTPKPRFFERDRTSGDLVEVRLVFEDWNASLARDPVSTEESLALLVTDLDEESSAKLSKHKISFVRIGKLTHTTQRGGGRKMVGESTDWLFHLSPSGEPEAA
jgi:hypothetical protein